MARTQITVQSITRSGLQPTNTALIADGHKFLNDGKLTFIQVENGATAFTLTIQTPKTVDGLAVAERTISIGTNEEHLIGPFPADTYNQADGMVYLDYSDVTDGTVSVLKLGT